MTDPGLLHLTLDYGEPWPQPSGTLKVIQLDDRKLHLEATVDDTSFWRMPAGTMRFEVSGYGRVGSARWSAARRRWTGPRPRRCRAARRCRCRPTVAAGIPPAPGWPR